MKIKQKILEFIQKAFEDQCGDLAASDPAIQNDREAIRELFDGMSTGTARIIIEEEIDGEDVGAYDIDALENKGRYYTARIVRPDGSAIRRLLVDKQTGRVQFAGR